MWIWQAAQWPKFEVNTLALQPTLAAARLAQGRLFGVVSSLQLAARGHGCVAARRMVARGRRHLADRRRDAADQFGSRIGRTPPGPDSQQSGCAEAAQAKCGSHARCDRSLAQRLATPLSAKSLLAWHAALFPTGQSGVEGIVVGGWRKHADPMQIMMPRLAAAPGWT